MGELKDEILICRQCGKDFTFTIDEQERYRDKGWAEPRHCPQCRSARRRVDVRVCSGCAAELAKEDPAYCSTCLDNMKRESESKQHEQQQRIAELEGSLKTANDVEKSLASATSELEKSQQANEELRGRVGALEDENLKLTEEKAPWHSLAASVQQLGEQLEAFWQSYACDVDKLTGLLLELQNELTQKRNVSLLHRIKLTLHKNGKPKDSPSPEGEKEPTKAVNPGAPRVEKVSEPSAKLN
jgi:septal ring factor EnvC (AmiA/AmiB activator)